MRVQIKNLKKVASRILKAIKTKERIVIYGDADLDGVTSVIILKDSIKSLGGKVTAIYFPDREKEGYGITEKGLESLEKYTPALFLVVDCGIGNFKEVKIAKKLGFEVVIIDHHEVLDKLPEASIIVDPKQKGDRYPFKQFAASGIVFKLSEALLKEKITEALRKDFLELVALSTIADMMPRTDENAEMIREGLSSLESTWRPGIKALLEIEAFRPLELSRRVPKINSLLNVRDVQNQLPASFRLLVSTNIAEARELTQRLFEKNLKRKERIREITAEVERKNFGKTEELIVFEGSDDWELVLLGVVASILSQKYQKPVFLFRKDKEESQGAIRAPSGFNLVEAMKGYSKKLETCGGHPQAAGFRIKNKYLEEFRDHLVDYFTKHKI